MLSFKNLASGQAVGQSTGVEMNETPFMQRHKAMCILESTDDRVVKLQESNDDGDTWSDVSGVSVSSGKGFFEVELAQLHRIDVSGGSAGTGSGDLVS